MADNLFKNTLEEQSKKIHEKYKQEKEKILSELSLNNKNTSIEKFKNIVSKFVKDITNVDTLLLAYKLSLLELEEERNKSDSDAIN